MSENTQNGLINVNLQPLADVTNNLIDKFADAVGWIATPRGARKDMETAVEVYIDEIKKDISLPAMIKAKKISQARKEIKEYCNIQDILDHAEDFGRSYDSHGSESMDEDWVMFFYDHAKNVTQEDAKVLWGKVLAEEYKSKGTIPKMLLHILSIMSPDQARAFESLCGFAPDSIEGLGQIIRVDPLISNDMTNKVLSSNGITYEALQDLKALGLLHHNVVDIVTIYEQDVSKLTAAYLYFGSIIEIRNFPDQFPRGGVLLTNAGKVLASLIERKRVDGFEEYVRDYYLQFGCDVTINKV